jgi:hypothetical protein
LDGHGVRRVDGRRGAPEVFDGEQRRLGDVLEQAASRLSVDVGEQQRGPTALDDVADVDPVRGRFIHHRRARGVPPHDSDQAHRHA